MKIAIRPSYSDFWTIAHMGKLPYEDATRIQRQVVEVKYDQPMEPDYILVLEHPPVFTLGSRGGRRYLVVSEKFLREKGIAVIPSERGGWITYHGPGQLVVYPIFRLRDRALGITEYVEGLEEVMIRVAAEWGVFASRDKRNRGVWVGHRKLGSVGIAVRHGICFHGMAFNGDMDLSPFTWIQPCGLSGVEMTSLSRETSRPIDMADLRTALVTHWKAVFNGTISYGTLDDRVTLFRAVSNHLPVKPNWIKRRLTLSNSRYQAVQELMENTELHTVCQEAQCPNRWECFSNGTATFLILGDRCSRNCRFCAIAHGPVGPPDPSEPAHVARAAESMKLSYAVVTSVTRDDLSDGGSGVFAQVIFALKQAIPKIEVEILIPDFQGSEEALETVLAAGPEVLNHNVETVPRLHPKVRPQADYSRSLNLLKRVSLWQPSIPTKSGLMLGLGETMDEVEAVCRDLLEVGCRLLTVGQYLQPGPDQLPVIEYIHPRVFDQIKEKALAMGFRDVASGPFVRSSYKARGMYNNFNNL